MTITLNNNIENFDTETLTITEILEIKNYTFKMLVTKVNGNFIKRSDYEKVFVKNGDNVSILHLISGG